MAWAPEFVPEDDGPAAAGAAPGTTAREAAERPSARHVAGLTGLEVLRILDSGPRGLVEAEAEARLGTYGENVPPNRRPVSWPRRMAGSLRDPFTAVLSCLAVVSAVVAAWPTAAVIGALVVVGCVLRTSGEYRAERSTAALRVLAADTATVRRRPDEDSGPLTREIPVDQLVPGDVVRLGPGDPVPADVRLLRADGLGVRQAALTGESVPVAKYVVDAPVDPGAGLFEQPHLCFQGSGIAAGSATAVVVATGADTGFAGAYGRGGPVPETAFDRSVRGISWTLVRFMLLTPPLVLTANAALRGKGLETLPFAVAVAVALTPEMLPVIVTTVLARGASSLARDDNVIVKRLPALHDLGAIDVLCTDKTGTLTRDRPVLHCHVDPDGRSDPRVLRWAAVNAWWTLHLADLPVPDPLDEAILDAVAEYPDADGEDGVDLGAYEGIAALPIDPTRRLSTAVVADPGSLPGRHVLVVKGAPEEVLARCARVRTPEADADLDDAGRLRLAGVAHERAEDGLRVLAVAVVERRPGFGASTYTPADERGLTFVGFVGLRDAAADTAVEALAALARHHVAVKVLTGDHPGTAARACRDIGLPPGTVVTADHLDDLSDLELAALVRTATVFARCRPEHKARIVDALRADGHVVGFLGDGVNDLPALEAADVGICPRDAVEVVREAADVVLAEKGLTAIDAAIDVGRRSSGNVAAYLRITLSSNLGNVIAMLAAGLLLPFLPMSPAQVLVQNLCFDAAQLAFAFDRPRTADPGRPLLLGPREVLRFVTGFGLLNALADLATFAVLAAVIHTRGAGGGQALFHAGWFTENLLTQALVMVLLRSGRAAAAGGGTLGPVRCAAGVLALVGVLLPLSPVAGGLGMTALPGVYYVLVMAVLALYGTALVFARRRYDRRRGMVPAA